MDDRPLPPGWSKQVDGQGRTYFVDHNTKTYVLSLSLSLFSRNTLTLIFPSVRLGTIREHRQILNSLILHVLRIHFLRDGRKREMIMEISTLSIILSERPLGPIRGTPPIPLKFPIRWESVRVQVLVRVILEEVSIPHSIMMFRSHPEEVPRRRYERRKLPTKTIETTIRKWHNSDRWVSRMHLKIVQL